MQGVGVSTWFYKKRLLKKKIMWFPTPFFYYVGACKDIDYALLSDPKRNRHFNEGYTKPHCDATREYVQGDWKGDDVWYRFVEPAGSQLADSIVPPNHCGTLATGWLNGEHPQTLEENVTREVCFNFAGNSCWRRTAVEIKKCAGFFLYKFKFVPRCDLKYCGQWVASLRKWTAFFKQ